MGVAVEYRLPCLAADPSVYALVSVTAMCAWRALQSMSCSTHWRCYVSDVGLHALVAVFALWVHALQFPFSLLQWRDVVCHGNIADLACLLVRDCEKVYLFRSPFSLVWLFKPFYEFVYVALMLLLRLLAFFHWFYLYVHHLVLVGWLLHCLNGVMWHVS
jgi:hypothetical protein